MFKKMLKNERGLTLIELLAVVVILGIIAAIAVPSIAGIINNSREDAQVAEAIQIISAAKIANTEAGNATFSRADLNEFLENVDDPEFTVTYNATTRQYSIADHDANAIEGLNNPATERQLQDFTR